MILSTMHSHQEGDLLIETQAAHQMLLQNSTRERHRNPQSQQISNDLEGGDNS